MGNIGSAVPYVWKCCGGETFLHVPGLGLAHVPQSWDAIVKSHLFLIYGFCFVFLSMLLWIVFSIANWLWNCTRGGYLSFHGAKVAPAIAMVILPSLLTGAPGRYIVDFAGLDRSVLGAHDLQQLQAWRRRPAEAPFGRVRALSDASKRLLHLRGPEGNQTVFSEVESARIARRVMEFQQSHWTLSAGLSHGAGIFLLGYKYGAQIFNGSFPKLNVSRVRELWTEFDDVFERVREWCEIAFGAPARLQRGGGLWPPAFIIHMPSVAETLREVMDVHADQLFGDNAALNKAILAEISARANWSKPSCAWHAQFSVVIALSVHKGGSGLEYYEIDDNGALQLKDLEHHIGRAHVIESERAHNLRPFADGDGLHPRMVLHAFVFPCWPSDRPDAMEMQVVGTIGR